MPKSLLLVLAAAVVLAAGGCATTGDPKAGGLFGWSEAKAQQRQSEARAALEQEELRGAELKAEKQRLQSQINTKKRQLDDLKKKSSASSGGPSPAEQAEMRRLEQEIDQMTRQSLVLMDL